MDITNSTTSETELQRKKYNQLATALDKAVDVVKANGTKSKLTEIMGKFSPHATRSEDCEVLK